MVAQSNDSAYPVLAATRSMLDARGWSGPLAEVALALAEQIDAGDDVGSALAALSRELRSVLTELAAAPVAKEDELDALRRSREQRRA